MGLRLVTQLFSPVFAHAVAHQEVTEICRHRKVWLRRKSREISITGKYKKLCIIVNFFGSAETNSHQLFWLKTALFTTSLSDVKIAMMFSN